MITYYRLKSYHKMVNLQRLLLILQVASLFDESKAEDYIDNSSIFLRLLNPNSNTTSNNSAAGRLEIFYNGSWGTVCDDAFSDAGARVVCASLGFGRSGRFISNSYGPGNGTIWLDDVLCNGSELSIIDCPHLSWGSHNCGHNEDVSIRCSDPYFSARLVNSDSNSTSKYALEGRLEIYIDLVWGTVCDNYFTDAGANIVCENLGFGRTGRFISNSYGTGNGPIFTYKSQCNTSEVNITDCFNPSLGTNYCSHSQDVAVRCGNSSVFVRLFNPSSNTTNNTTMEGRLEVYYNGVWGRVCSNSFSDREAQVVCASLGFDRAGRSIRNSYGAATGPVLLDSVLCNGDELSITDCQHSRWGSSNYSYYEDAAIRCHNSSIFIRLVDPNLNTASNTTMEGRLEVYYNGVWGRICVNSFSDNSAQVVCGSLGFGRTGRFISNSYGVGNGTILLDRVSCKGTELSITDCQISRWGSSSYCSYEDVSIRCSNSSIFVRLFNPNSTITSNGTSEGRLEIYYNGVWGTVCANRLTNANVQVVCASLGYGRTGRFIHNSYGPGKGPVLLDNVVCSGTEQSITDCPHSRWGSSVCAYSKDLAIRCSNSSVFIRLFDPNSTTTSNDTLAGRLEIYYNGVWGTVCDSSITNADAQVVCANLGFGRHGRVIRNTYGPRNGAIMLDYVGCKGNEPEITDCQHSGLGSSNCSHDEDVAISCSNSSVFVRLFNPNSRTTSNDTLEGRLEIYYNGDWGTVCDDGFSDKGAQVVCASLGFGRIGRFINNTYGPGNGTILLDDVVCNGYELSITVCPRSAWYYHNCNHGEDVSISCTNSTTGVVSTLGNTIRTSQTSKATTEIVSTLRQTTQKTTNLKSPQTSKTTTRTISTLGHNTQRITTLRSPETSTATSGIAGTIGYTTPEVTATAIKVASTTYDVKLVSTTSRTMISRLGACETLQCVNGTCFTDNSTSTCSCTAGYRGNLCDEDIAECDSDPCQHGSTCVDGLNSYECRCLSGYTGKNCETDVNECESSPCPINSTCEDSINRYQCICPNPNEFIGLHCKQPTSVLSQENSDSPQFINVSPKYGPKSGGTMITIEGTNLEKYGGISFIYIGNKKLPIKNWTSSWSEFFVVTTAGESSIVNQDQNLTFEITGGKNISTNYIFTYQPDPEIEDVRPTDHLTSGGTTLTIIGKNLNSSAAPYLRVILNTTTSGRMNRNITIINGPTCNASSSFEIYCLMPRVNVAGVTLVNQTASGRRNRRDGNSPNVTTYLTLILESDGAEDVPNKSVKYFAYDGVLDPIAGPVSFDPAYDPFIYIKGKSLSAGIAADDYEIYVGTGACTNKSLTTNQLSCRPPIEEPDPGNFETHYCSQSEGLPVIIFPGRQVSDDGDRIKLIWGCLIYPTSTSTWWIVGAICGGSCLLLIATVVSCVLCRRRLKRLRKAAKQRDFSTTDSADSNFHPGTPDWTKLWVDAPRKSKNKPRSDGNDTFTSRFTNDLSLNHYRSNERLQEFFPDYDRTLVTDWTRGGPELEPRGHQLIQNEPDVIAADGNTRDLRNPVRYSYGLLSGDNSIDAATHNRSDYMNNSELTATKNSNDWRNQSRRLRPTTPRQFGANWRATNDNSITLAPALRANRHDFLGQNKGFNSPVYGSFQLPTATDSTGNRSRPRNQ